MATFEPTLDIPATDANPSADYVSAMNAIAPGFWIRVQQQQRYGQSWIDAARESLSLFSMTDSQRALLSAQLDQASQGLPPVATLDASEGTTIMGDIETGFSGPNAAWWIAGAAALVLLLTRR